MGIDWEKEKGNIDYCGYCNSPQISSCNGTCWSNNDNKKHHLKTELDKVKKRMQDIKDELKKLSFVI